MTGVCALGTSVLSIVGVEGGSPRALVLVVMGLATPLLILLNALGNYQAKSFRYRLAAERMNRERRKYVNFTVPIQVSSAKIAHTNCSWRTLNRSCRMSKWLSLPYAAVYTH